MAGGYEMVELSLKLEKLCNPHRECCTPCRDDTLSADTT